MNVRTNNEAWTARDVQIQTREQDRMIVQEMTGMVKMIMSLPEGSGVQWVGSKTDLLEMLKTVCDKGTVVLSDGSVAGFTYLINKTFALLGIRQNNNPYAMVQRAMSRKGIRVCSLADRLRRVMFSEDEADMEGFWNTLIVRRV